MGLWEYTWLKDGISHRAHGMFGHVDGSCDKLFYLNHDAWMSVCWPELQVQKMETNDSGAESQLTWVQW